MANHSLKTCKIAVVGLGYVGLPLAVEFGKRYSTVGFDIKSAHWKPMRRN
jgi:UDP-N-acetyl-D-galactosamine dehydrogenase